MIDSSQIKKMSTAEKLHAMEQLWDALRQHSADLPSPEWHRELLEERKARVDSGEANFISLDELKARLRSAS